MTRFNHKTLVEKDAFAIWTPRDQKLPIPCGARKNVLRIVIISFLPIFGCVIGLLAIRGNRVLSCQIPNDWLTQGGCSMSKNRNFFWSSSSVRLFILSSHCSRLSFFKQSLWFRSLLVGSGSGGFLGGFGNHCFGMETLSSSGCVPWTLSLSKVRTLRITTAELSRHSFRTGAVETVLDEWCAC